MRPSPLVDDVGVVSGHPGSDTPSRYLSYWRRFVSPDDIPPLGTPLSRVVSLHTFLLLASAVLMVAALGVGIVTNTLNPSRLSEGTTPLAALYPIMAVAVVGLPFVGPLAMWQRDALRRGHPRMMGWAGLTQVLVAGFAWVPAMRALHWDSPAVGERQMMAVGGALILALSSWLAGGGVATVLRAREVARFAAGRYVARATSTARTQQSAAEHQTTAPSAERSTADR